MTAPDGLIRIPLNEESKQGGGQIEEYLMAFGGEGIQHIALLTDNLTDAIDQLKAAGVPLMTAPNDTYYEMLDERLPNYGEHVDSLKTQGILLDGDNTKQPPRIIVTNFFRNSTWARIFLSLFSVKGIIEKDLVKVILKHYLNHLNETKFAVVL